MPGRHLLCSDPADLDAGLLALWRAWRTPERSVERSVERLHVVVPTRAHRAACKRLLVEAGLPLFNVSFLLPNHLRQLLSEELLAMREPLWGREELDFLLRQLARGLAGQSPLCLSLARDPAPLRRALDELAGAGHSFRALLAGHSEADRRDLDALRRAWEAIDPQLLPGLRAYRDACLRQEAAARPGALAGRLILFGCDIRNAPDFTLFEAALLAWREPAVFTLLAAAGQETVQGPWLDLVERALPGADTALPAAEAVEMAPGPAPAIPRRFYLAPGKGAAAGLIVRQVRAWLRDAETAPRIGIVFPAASPLASRVGQLLRDGDIPFTSAFPTALPLRFEQTLLRDWLELQRSGLWAEPFLLFWRKAAAVPSFAARFGEPEPLPGSSSLEDRLERAHGEILSDEVPVLAALLRGQEKSVPALEKFLGWWEKEGLWPDTAPLEEYLRRFGEQLDLLVGSNLGQPVRGHLAGELSRLARLWREPVPRAAAADLLEKFVARPEVARDFTDWAPVHLVPPDEARAIEWDYLFLAELEEGVWPQLDRPATFLDDGLRERLNRQAQMPSPAGGEETVYQPGISPLLTGTTRYRLARETFASLLESAGREIALCAGTWDEIEADRETYPSEFFRQAWEERGERGPWSDAARESLLRAAEEIAPASTGAEAEIEAMQKAHHHRRDPRTAFDEFSFMLRERPHAHPLSAKAAEATLQDPATAWFKALLKIDPERPDWSPDARWPLFQGLILHRLFERSLARFRVGDSPWTPVPEAAAWRAALDDEAAQAEGFLRRAFAAADREPPAWWASEWPRLRAALRQLHDKLRAQLPDGFTHVAAEFRLESPGAPPDSPLPALPWKSRADLIALDGPDLATAGQALVVDFKTGSGASDFKATETAAKAAYFQLVVYAALLRAGHPGLKETSIAILHRGSGPIAAPTLVDPADPAYAGLWTALRAAWIDGHWGQFLALRDRFKKTSHLPLATLDIPDHLLSAKWALTPGLREWDRKRE